VRSSTNRYYKVNDYWQGQPVTDYAFATLYEDGGRYVLYLAGISGYATRAVCTALAHYDQYALQGIGVVFELYDAEGDGQYETIQIIETTP